MACKKPNFTSKNRISITIHSDDNADSILETILGKRWGFAINEQESESPDNWNDSISLFINAIEKHLQNKGVDQNMINEIKTKLSVALTSNEIDVEDNEDNAAEIPEAGLDLSKQKEQIKLDIQLRNIFGDDRILKQKFFSQFKHNIFTKSIIRIGKSVTTSAIVYNIEELNKTLMAYQQQLHENVYNFLKKNNLLPEGRKVANLFDEEGNINPFYSKNMNAFQEYLNSQENLQKLVSTKAYSGDTELLTTINSFLALQYFDKLMLQSVGKYLYINTKQSQPIVREDDRVKYKYSINRKNVNLASGWQQEVRDGLEEIGSFSQLIIEQIPIINTDKYLNKVSLISAFLKLRYALNQLGDSSSPQRIQLREALKDLNKNTIGAWKTILEILNNAKIDGRLHKDLIAASSKYGKEKMSLTDTDFIVFDSVYDYFFNRQNGVYHIERANEFKGGRSVYGITESLFATINSTVQANYLEFKLVKGRPTLQQKAPWNSRQRMFQLAKSINEKVFRSVDNTFLTGFIIKPNGNVLFGDFEIDVSSRKSLGIFSPNLAILNIKKDGKKIILDNYFKEELESLYSEEGRKDLLDPNYEDNKEFRDVLEKIDDKLGTHFLSEEGLQQLRIFTELHQKPLHNLFLQAARIAGAYYINTEFKLAQTLDPTLTNFDMLKWLKEYNPTPYTGLKFLSKSDSLIYKYEGGLFISGVENSSTVLEKISDAEYIFQGDNNKSVTKNLDGKNVPNVSVTFTDAIQEFKDQESGVEANLLFAGNNSKYIVDTLIDIDVETLNGHKSVDQFTNSELLYHFVVNKFIYGMEQMGTFISQPVTYSDKKKFINFSVNWKDLYSRINKDFENPYKIPKSAHIQLMQETQGEYYRDIFHKVADDYRVIFGINNDDDSEVFLLANELMQNESKDSFIKKAYDKGIKVFEDLHYRKIGTGVSPNETLYNYVTNIFNNLEDFLRSEEIGYLNQLLNNYVIISANEVVMQALNKAVENTETSASSWVEDGLLVLAKVNGKNIVAGETIPLEANVVVNPLIESYFYFHNVIDNNIKLGLSGHELHHAVKNLPKVLRKFNKETGLNTTTYFQAETLAKGDPDLREALNKAYYTVISLSHNAQFKRTVPIPGTIRPFDQGTLKGIASTYNVAVVQDIAALTHDFLGNHGFEDASSSVDAHDGSAWVDPFTSILENYSLDDSEGGEVKKPLWDIDEQEYGVRRLVKYASNTITNRIMLQSSKSSIKMYKLFKKMTNTFKLNDIDLVDDWILTSGYKKDSSFVTNIINEENPLFYSHNGHYYQILNFGKDYINGEKVYYTIEDEVDQNGDTYGSGTYKVYHYFDENSNHIKVKEGEIPSPGMHTINSLFELHAAMGGIESMSKEDDTLNFSEASNRAVAHFMIYVTKPGPKYDKYVNGEGHYKKDADITQEYFEQPLKTRLINCLINKSAIKNGASCINPTSSLFDDSELMFDTYSTLKYGIQQDSDHVADEGRVTEMSQVISALDANGQYHEEVHEIYKILGEQSIKAAQIELDAIRLGDNTPEGRNKLYDIIGKTLINNIQRDERGLTKAILYQIRKNFNLSTDHNLDKIKIPFSDPNIYGKILQVVGSILNKKSIKRKYPGLGQVMVPSFGIYQVWEIEGKKYQYKDLLKRAIEYNEELGDEAIEDIEDPIEFNNKIVEQYLESVSPNKTLYDNNYAKNKESIELIYSRTPELSDIGTQEEYAEYLSQVYPNTTDKSIDNIYFLGTQEDLQNFRKWKENNTKKELDLTEIDPTNNLSVTYIDIQGNVQTKNVVLASLPDYYDFKENPIKFLKQKLSATLISSIEKNNKVPRDLAPFRAHFTYEYNGQQFTTNLYDTWIYKEMYQVMKLKKQDPINAKQYDQIIESYQKQIPGFLSALEKGIYVFKDRTTGIIISMHKQAAETIMSNVYASRLGIKKGDEIPDIDSPEYFKTDLTKQLDGSIYDFDLQLITKNNNDNIYISLNSLSEESTENYQTQYLPWRVTNLLKEKTNDPKVINRVYYIDNNNIKHFEIGRDIDVSDEIYYDVDTNSFKNKVSGEVVTDRKLFREGDKILEYVEFLIKQEIKPKNKHKFTKYTIDQHRLNRVLLKGEKINNATTNIIDDLYHSDSFLIITPAKKIKKSNYDKIRTIIRNLSERNKNNEIGNYLRNILSNVFTLGKGTVNGEGYVNLQSGNIVDLNRKVEALGIDREKLQGEKLISLLRTKAAKEKDFIPTFNNLRKSFNQSKLSYWQDLHAEAMSKKQYASFKKSLFFTSSRIPAQTLQSFMQMENIGFNGVDTNYCAVSHFQTFLQGSDYDIDKSYMMGLSFDNNGIYLGWSDLFNYNSLEEIEASEELPMPKGKHYSFTQNKENADVIIGTKEANAIINETDTITQLKLIAALLKRLNKETDDKQNITVYLANLPLEGYEDLPIGGQDFLNQYLNKHESTKFGNNVDEVLKNYISSNIQKLIQKLGNLADAYTPVEIKALRDMLDKVPKQELATSLTLFNPAMIPIMQNTNMTGKAGTGIAANAQKGLFMWRFGMLDTLLNPNEDSKMVTFNVTIDRVLGRFKYNQDQLNPNIPIEQKSTLSPVTIESLPYMNGAKGFSLSPKIKSDNIGSQYISAATDNAKELILAAINSGTNLMKCHLYLVCLGFDVNDIISFMTSPAVSFIDSIADENIFNGTEIKVNDAINFAEDYLIQLRLYNKAETLEEKAKIQKEMDNISIPGVRIPIMNAFKNRLRVEPDIEGFLADLRALKEVLKGANEFSQFASILSINQGIPQTKEDLIAWKNKLKFALISGSRSSGLLNSKGEVQYGKVLNDYYYELIPKIFNENKELDISQAKNNNSFRNLVINFRGDNNIDDYIKNLSKKQIQEILIANFISQYGDIIDFDADLWLDSREYRNKTSEYYNLVKHSLNIFYLIDHLPHYKKMFEIGNILNHVDKRMSLKSLISNHYNKLLREKYPYAPKGYESKLLPAIDEILIGHYIKSTGLEIPLKPDWKTADSDYVEINAPKVLSLNTDSDISSFKYVFEKYIIPELQKGLLLDNNEQNQKVKDNPFIKNLTITDERGVPLYKEDINLMLIDNNEEVKRKYQSLLQGLKALRGINYQGIPLVDLFMLYNIVVNKNRYGSERLTEIFEDFILDYDAQNFNSSYLVRYLINLGNEDYSKELFDKVISSVTLTDLLLKVAQLVPNKDSSRQDPFIKMLVAGKGYQFFEKKGRFYSSDPIDLLLEIPGETYEQKLQREILFTEYGFGLVYSQYVNEVVNHLMSDNFENVLSKLIQNHTIFYNIKCDE